MGGFLLCFCFCLLGAGCAEPHLTKGGGQIQKRMYLHSGQTTVNICELRGYFLGASWNVGHHSARSKFLLLLQIGRCYLEPKALSLQHQPCRYIVPCLEPQSFTRVGTTNRATCEDSCGTKHEGLSCVFCLLPWWSPAAMFFMCLISWFAAFPLAPVCIPNFLAKEANKMDNHRAECQNVLDQTVTLANWVIGFLTNPVSCPVVLGKCWHCHVFPPLTSICR